METAELEEERKVALASERADLHRRAFGVSGGGSDTAALNGRMARQEALSTATSAGALTALIETAAASGDNVMLKAASRVALERGDIGALRQAATHDYTVGDVLKFERDHGALKSKAQALADSIRGGSGDAS